MATVPMLIPVFPYEVLATFKRSNLPGKRSNLPGAAGFHLLSAWGTITARGTRPFVAFHEDWHDRYLSTTPFGFMQRYFRSYFQPQVPQRWTQLATLWLRVLHHESEHAHEVAATYLPIKALRLEEQADAIRHLPPQNRKYYSLLASIIDEHARSSYVQYAVGEAIINGAFLSPILSRLAHNDQEAAIIVSADESPNERLERLRSLLDDVSTADLVTKLSRDLSVTAKGQGLDGFDINREADWIDLEPPVLQLLSKRLGEQVAEWFADRNYAGLPNAEIENVGADAGALVAIAKDRGVIIGNTNFCHEFSTLDSEDTRAVFGAADSVLVNDKVVDDSRIKHMPEDAFWVTPTNPPATTTVICTAEACTPEINHEWYVRTCGRTGNCSTAIVSQQQLRQFISTRNQVFLESGEDIDNDIYIIGLPAPVTDEARELTLGTMRAVLGMFATKPVKDEDWTARDNRTAHFLGLHRVVFYMHGNILAWATFIAGFSGARYFAYTQVEDDLHQTPSEPPPGGVSLAVVPTGIGVHVMRFDDAPITFVRLMNTFASSQVLAAIVEYANTAGKISILGADADEVIQTESLANLISSSVAAVWNIF